MFKVLSEAEEQTLIVNFLKARGAAGATEDEMERLIDWAMCARIDSVLLAQVLKGELSVDVAADGDLRFTLVEGPGV